MNETYRTIELRDGRTLGYAEYGQRDGKPVFHFHGWPSFHLDAAPADAAAKTAGVRLIAVDRPGFGASSFKAKRQLRDWPDDVLELADALGIERFAVAGQSGGGPYALACAYKISQRLTAAGVISGMTHMDRPNATEGVSMYPDRLGLILSKRAPWLLEPMMGLNGFLVRLMPAESMLKSLIAEMPPKDQETFKRPEVFESVKAMLTQFTSITAKGAAVDVQAIAGPWNFCLEDIRMRVHFWHGKEDHTVPPQIAEYFAAQVPDRVATYYPEEGHAVFYSHADEILSTLAAA